MLSAEWRAVDRLYKYDRVACVFVQIGYSEFIYMPYRSSPRLVYQNTSGRFTPTDLQV